MEVYGDFHNFPLFNIGVYGDFDKFSPFNMEVYGYFVSSLLTAGLIANKENFYVNSGTCFPLFAIGSRY